ncbi:hypothetical protein E2C01_076304 [Portunus trituberculatus]|uniref:Uncharacterized protein n=1 Tax=Portunus trituberculatus TaxID=210409 RepID=A0A5B7IHI2_PORTR|nr:hypothetical protein [Portunus trituberculatus]
MGEQDEEPNPHWLMLRLRLHPFNWPPLWIGGEMCARIPKPANERVLLAASLTCPPPATRSITFPVFHVLVLFSHLLQHLTVRSRKENRLFFLLHHLSQHSFTITPTQSPWIHVRFLLCPVKAVFKRLEFISL